MTQIVAGRQRFFAVADTVKRGHQRRHLGENADGGAPALFRAVHDAVRVKHADRAHARHQGVHGVSSLGQTFDEVDNAELEAPVAAQFADKVVQLLWRRQLSF